MKLVYLLGLVVVIMFVSCAVDGNLIDQMRAEAQAVAELERHARTDVFLTNTAVSVPIGRFMLFRRGGDVCAIHFTKMYRGNDAHPPTRFSSGEESLYSDYEWYHPNGGGADFSSSKLESGHGTASRKAPFGIGIGHRMFGWGNRFVRCGPYRLDWAYPNILEFPFLAKHPEEYELAPTKWQDIREVNAQDPRLKWYRYDEKRKDIYIPVDELW